MAPRIDEGDERSEGAVEDGRQSEQGPGGNADSTTRRTTRSQTGVSKARVPLLDDGVEGEEDEVATRTRKRKRKTSLRARAAPRPSIPSEAAMSSMPSMRPTTNALRIIPAQIRVPRFAAPTPEQPVFPVPVFPFAPSPQAASTPPTTNPNFISSVPSSSGEGIVRLSSLAAGGGGGARTRVVLPTPVPNLTKKSRGRRVPALHAAGQAAASSTPAQELGAAELGTRMHVCAVDGCGKCFRRGEHLKRHIRSIHTHEKPFPCTFPDCDKFFNRHDNLLQHLKVHQPREEGHSRANSRAKTGTGTGSSGEDEDEDETLLNVEEDSSVLTTQSKSKARAGGGGRPRKRPQTRTRTRTRTRRAAVDSDPEDEDADEEPDAGEQLEEYLPHSMPMVGETDLATRISQKMRSRGFTGFGSHGRDEDGDGDDAGGSSLLWGLGPG